MTQTLRAIMTFLNISRLFYRHINLLKISVQTTVYDLLGSLKTNQGMQTICSGSNDGIITQFMSTLY